MKKLFLLPLIALIAVFSISTAISEESGTCCDNYGDNNNDCQGDVTESGCTQLDGTFHDTVSGYSNYECATRQTGGLFCHLIPEFTTIGAGIAVIGAGAGYALIRRKRK